MRDTKTALVSLPVKLLLAASLCIYKAQTEKKLELPAKSEIKVPVKLSTKTTVWKVIVTIMLTKILESVVVHGHVEENALKSNCGGARLKFNIRKMKNFISKSDNTKIFQFKIWRAVKFLIEFLTRCIIFGLNPYMLQTF